MVPDILIEWLENALLFQPLYTYKNILDELYIMSVRTSIIRNIMYQYPTILKTYYMYMYMYDSTLTFSQVSCFLLDAIQFPQGILSSLY